MALQALCDMATTSTYKFSSRVHLAAYASAAIKAILDTGCTDHFLPLGTPVSNLTKNPFGIIVGLPDKSTMKSTHTGNLQLPDLPQEARATHLFPKMNAPLLSIPKLCDAGCKAEFKRHCVTVTDSNGAVVLKGGRDPATNLWTVNLDSNPTNNKSPTKKDNNNMSIRNMNQLNFANSAYKQKTASDVVAYLHATAGYPVADTWCTDIDKGYFTSWPGLTS